MNAINKRNLFLAAIVLLAITAVFASTRVFAQVPAPVSASTDLTTLSAGDASAYRWLAMAKFYARQTIPARSH